MNIPACKKIALVGASGCGKSTISNLVLRLYDILEGNILIDGGSLIVSGSFNNNGNGVVTVDNGGTLDVGVDYFNNGNGVVAANGNVEIGGNFEVNGNGTVEVAGGLDIQGDMIVKSGGIEVQDGGVVRANDISSEGDIDVLSGGTIFAPNGVESTSGNIRRVILRMGSCSSFRCPRSAMPSLSSGCFSTSFSSSRA